MKPAANKLTTRQLETLANIAMGDTFKEVGKRMGISKRTVEKHVQAARLALRAKSCAHAVFLEFAPICNLLSAMRRIE